MADVKEGEGLSRSDYQPLPMPMIKLDGTNYLVWSRSTLLTIAGRGLSGHLHGTTAKPTAEGVAQDRWVAHDSLVMAYLLNSMIPDLARGYMLLDTAAIIWTTVKSTYSQLGTDAQVYDLHKRVHETKQAGRTVSQYYSDLRTCWQEMDVYSDFQPSVAADITKYNKHLDKRRVYTFLAGLHVDYDQIRVQILGKDPFPTLEQAYAYVHTEECRRTTMLPTQNQDRSALQAGTVSDTPPTGLATSTSTSTKDPVKCEHCGRLFHTKATCWMASQNVRDLAVDISSCMSFSCKLELFWLPF